MNAPDDMSPTMPHSSVEFREFATNLARAAEPLKQAFAALAAAMPSVIAAGKVIYDSFYAAYQQQGAIYGDNHEGFLRWIRECQEIAEHERRAEELRQHHQMLADLRQRVKPQKAL